MSVRDHTLHWLENHDVRTLEIAAGRTSELLCKARRDPRGGSDPTIKLLHLWLDLRDYLDATASDANHGHSFPSEIETLVVVSTMRETSLERMKALNVRPFPVTGARVTSCQHHRSKQKISDHTTYFNPPPPLTKTLQVSTNVVPSGLCMPTSQRPC